VDINGKTLQQVLASADPSMREGRKLRYIASEMASDVFVAKAVECLLLAKASIDPTGLSDIDWSQLIALAITYAPLIISLFGGL
jgi:hypothetical protein